jgi:hypothetical protein
MAETKRVAKADETRTWVTIKPKMPPPAKPPRIPKKPDK